MALTVQPCWKFIIPDCSLAVTIYTTSFTYLLTHLLTYLPTRGLLKKLRDLQLVKKFPAFYGTRRFITAFTSVRQLFLPLARSIQSIHPHPTSWSAALILSSRLRLGLPSGLFPSGYPTKTLYTPLPLPICSTCPAHPILLDLITRTIVCELYRLLSSSLRNFLHSLVLTLKNSTFCSHRQFMCFVWIS
jgi:hypothetical protein